MPTYINMNMTYLNNYNSKVGPNITWWIYKRLIPFCLSSKYIIKYIMSLRKLTISPFLMKDKKAARCTKHPAYAGSGEGSHPKCWIVGGIPCFQWPIPRLEPLTFKSHGTSLTSVPRLPFWWKAKLYKN